MAAILNTRHAPGPYLLANTPGYPQHSSIHMDLISTSGSGYILGNCIAEMDAFASHRQPHPQKILASGILSVTHRR
jgi:hypothetical protein